ncbi:MAG: phage tail protein [bacterium]
MAQPFVGEIRMFAGNFAPRNWAFCDGQLIPISENAALFSLLGTIYGGDGHSTFGLPDMRGRIPIHAGSGPGLSPRPLGAKGGAENITLTVNELPSHNHGSIQASEDPAASVDPAGKTLGVPTSTDLYADDLSPVNMSSNAITSKGGSQSHTNLMPFLCINFIIALYGIYPSRT